VEEYQFVPGNRRPDFPLGQWRRSAFVLNLKPERGSRDFGDACDTADEKDDRADKSRPDLIKGSFNR
jgi:hypothetical protein